MKSIPILLKLNTIENKDEHIIETHGILIYYMKKQYIVTLHQGLPIKEIIIKDRDKEYSFLLSKNEFIICKWNDLILIPCENTFSNLFVFKQFVKKQINVNSNYYFDTIYNIKYIENDSFPINMIPYNPSNIYYKMTSEISTDFIAGKPIYNDNKLIGIIAKVEGNIIYVIPSLYITKSIEKKDNSIYTIDTLNVTKLGYYKIINNRIYYNKLNNMIPLESYLLLEGDNDKNIHIIINGINKRIKYTPFINTIICNNNMIDIVKNKIHITSSFIHLMKICYNDIRIITKIFEYMDSKKQFNYIINNISYLLLF